MPALPSAIILVIDRLGAGYLGPYGNTWLETPAFNQLAARSLLCEHVLAASPDLAGAYRDYWLGSASDPGPSLAQFARLAGYRSVLVTDEPALKQTSGADDFDELHFVERAANLSQPADDPADTAFAALLEVALGQLATWREAMQPQLLWIHAGSLAHVWDAPLELRAQFGDEDDPPPSPTVTPPEQRLPTNHDPDELLSLAHAYAGQVAVIDGGLEHLLAAVGELPQRDNLLLAVTSPRGYPLGEHGRVGPCDHALYSELLSVPLLVQLPAGEGALRRTQELIQPVDLLSTLQQLIDPTVARSQSLLNLLRDEGYRSRKLALAHGLHDRAIRSRAWQLRVTTTDAGDHSELFTKPDDRWDYNDIASRCGSIVEQLQSAATAFTAGEPAELPDELTSVWR